MYPELGQLALILALLLSVLLAVVPLAGALTGRDSLQAFARPLASGMFVFTGLAFAILTHAFLVDDFSVAYVANNSNSMLPWYYKFSAVWGGHEGSLLLWILMLTGWTLAVAIFSRKLPSTMVSQVLAVMGMVCVGFFLFIIVTSNPFDRLLPNVPADGQDLNPLLQDIGLIMHPPMLYMGYVGFSVAFAFAIAALINGRLDAAWARWSRPWTTVAWSFLTIGIALGSWWAYYELGWGGWWFWDPVENASLLPWLSGTALMHSLAVTEKRGVFKSWTVLLAIVTFALSLLGTFLVRSGVLTSVHAFASDPERGSFLLMLLGITVVGSLLLYAFRAPVVHVRSRYGSLSREIFLLLNNVLLVSATLLVAIGTLYPLVLDYLDAGKLSIGEPFFNTTFSPLAVATGLLLGAGIFSRWKKTDGGMLARKLLWPLAISLVATAAVMVNYGSFAPWAFAGVFTAIWIAVATLWDLWDKSASRQGRLHGLKRQSRSYWGMVLGHLGVAMVMAGATVVSNYGVERDVRMTPGDSAMVGDYEIVFTDIGERQGANFTAQYGSFNVFLDGKLVTDLHPEKRNYPVGMSVMTEADIDAGLFRDVFVAIGERISDDAWAIRLQYKPLVRWLWLGSLVMAIGGFLAIADKRYRIRVKAEEKQKAQAGNTAPGKPAEASS
ncbi:MULTISPECIES: heme lyase CcmF/NrfE family subunit [Marinobacter]|uniref:Heme lyase CcmF/NrfE family subunit n=1 Tax=Marinobacter vinifirmus TaxID=355591 RepID=A0A558BGY7_9GAMM|nr:MULTISPECIES: heme lyase CcmF/NrfE family subunit [Marinobacter]KRW83255.1 cytochrome C biogenesis protein CcmF [Marinobacter sp. P4B1]TVT35779.1 MAG: heme lyase CcmF/NrfE family subunit [Marinobacter vinifirmus]